MGDIDLQRPRNMDSLIIATQIRLRLGSGYIPRVFIAPFDPRPHCVCTSPGLHRMHFK